MSIETGAPEESHLRPFKRLIVAQVVIATIACAILITLGLTIRPLIETRARLMADIRAKQLEIRALDEKRAFQRRELALTEKTLEAATRKIAQTNPMVKSLENEIGSQRTGAVRPVSQKDAYVVVLGSYRHFGGAKSAVPALQAKLGEQIHLFYAVNDYFAPAIGPISTRLEAERKLQVIRSKVPDGYVFTMGAFLYEIDLGTETK
jgi:hypothetical protein